MGNREPFDIKTVDKKTGKPTMSEEELSALKAKIHTTPSVSNSLALRALHESADWDVMWQGLQEINVQVMNGDLSCAEALLIDQAYVLQSIFSNYPARMTNAEYLSQIDTYSKIALRAQNQCQRTLKTLLEYKNPKRTTFIKQQNNATNQQINDGELKEIPKKEIKPANELLEVNHDSRLDTRETQEAITVDTELETVGEIDRTAHGTG